MSLKWTNVVVDENVPRQVVEHLRSLGFKSVVWINDYRTGQSDPEVWRYAASKQALLVTGDRGFAPQLTDQEMTEGPHIVCFSTKGMKASELQDPEVMRILLDWLFRNEHHTISEWHTIRVDGDACTRSEMASRTKPKRPKL